MADHPSVIHMFSVNSDCMRRVALVPSARIFLVLNRVVLAETQEDASTRKILAPC